MKHWQLDGTLEIPLHTQLAKRIQAEIQSGELTTGAQIPSERELMQLAQVSRATVRHAVDQLVQENLLERVQGKGTFVLPIKVEASMQLVYSFAEQFRAQGFELQDRLLDWEYTPATPTLAQQLGIEPGESIVSLKRLRCIEDSPVILSMDYLPYHLCPDLPGTIESGRSLYRLLTDAYDLPIVSATDTLEAVSADEETAASLSVLRNTALMYVKRTAYTHNHIPIHIGYNYVRGDVCRFRSDMHAKPAAIELKSTVGL